MRLLTLPLMGFGSFLSESWTAMRGETPLTEVPPLEPSFGAVLEAALDRSFTLGVNLLAGVPNPSEIRRARLAMQRAAAVVEAQGWLDDPAAFYRTPPPLENWEATKHTAFQLARRVPYEQIRFESGYQPHPALEGDRWSDFVSNRDGYAYVLEHEEFPDRPWLVCIHGFSMGDPISNFPAFNAHRLHHELGLNVLMPVLPLHGPRASGRTSGGEMMASDFVNMIHFFAQAVWDIRRLLSWLRASGAQRIGLWGVSMGGYTAALLSAFAADLECVIAGVPPTDFPNVARDNLPWIMRTYEHDLATDWEAVRKMMYPVSPLTFDPVVPKDRRFIYAGIADRVVRPDQARALWRHWGRPEIRWFSGGHVAMQMKTGVIEFV
jgi:pimeloyl-ACP methyl ester carboxylesterase